jgi:hypothetical protein
MALALAYCGLVPRGLAAQHRGAIRLPPPAAETTQFDFLVGDWQYVAKTTASGIPPVFRGTWHVWRLDGGRGIADEYRALGDSGTVAYYGLTVRTWDAEAGRWNIAYIDRGMNGQWGRLQTGEGRFKNGEMHLLQRVGQRVLRIRYHNIRPDSFNWVADRSTDGGATWQLAVTTIEARRVQGAASHEERR